MTNETRELISNLLEEAKDDAYKVALEELGADRRSCIQIFEEWDFGKGIAGELTVNWSAIGSQSPAIATHFAKALAKIAEIANHYNIQRRKLLGEEA